jgi:predicted porin
MKKSLIALAALATVATVAQAQSSVTMYGIIDPTLISVSTQGAGRVTALSHGGASTSRWGFRGEEDLGGGLKAFFNLEGQFEADTGEGSATGLFHRASFVGLKNSMVSGQAGRMNRLDYARIAKYDAFSGNNVGGATAYVALSGAAVMPDVRANNMLQIDVTPISGLTVSAQHAFGEVAGTNAAGAASDSSSGGSAVRSNSYAVDYKTGPLEVAAVYVKMNTTTAAKLYERADVYARYNFGFLTAVVARNEYKPATGDKLTADWAGVTVPVNAKTTILANVVKLDLAADGKSPTGYGVGVQYALSKRTTAYGVYATIAQDSLSVVKVGGSAMNEIAAPGAGKDQSAIGFGIRHTF